MNHIEQSRARSLAWAINKIHGGGTPAAGSAQRRSDGAGVPACPSGDSDAGTAKVLSVPAPVVTCDACGHVQRTAGDICELCNDPNYLVTTLPQ